MKIINCQNSLYSCKTSSTNKSIKSREQKSSSNLSFGAFSSYRTIRLPEIFERLTPADVPQRIKAFFVQKLNISQKESLEKVLTKLWQDSLERFDKRIEPTETDRFLRHGLLFDIHKKVYKDLFSCTSLDEAKKLFPEFANVKNLGDLGNEYNKKGSLLDKILSDEVPALPAKTGVLKLLQLYYGAALPFSKLAKLIGEQKSTVQHFFRTLNIPSLKKEYSRYLAHTDEESYSKVRVQLKEISTQAVKDGRIKPLPRVFIKRTNFQDAMKAAHKACPEALEIRREVAKRFHLKEILDKKRRHAKLTPGQEKHFLEYQRVCNDELKKAGLLKGVYKLRNEHLNVHSEKRNYKKGG